ncbi:carbon-monoxide dehydrogenase small subunit [Tindallia magadiensis]|uniref:Carbon-monoxide dehydrogenase small subunit n=1 Tax=Tindallia magadiensis TaxID=69895 RepID=A0A1I3DAV3_9FIRM|nr:(2Fe-2S)-binding protein [Tindallia magadiensis]SFH83854.1 carbon-monoxide dehydrogenase small subunit [Tindallia magadiensis]
MKLNTKINGIEKILEIDPKDYLVEVLRDNGYLGVRQGCDTGNCGVCTVHLDGKAVLSCVLLAVKAEGREITTIEGVPEKAAKIASYFLEEGADQCGYCTSGTVMNILYLEALCSQPSEEEMIHHLKGNLCRCTGYVSQLRAIKSYFEGKADRQEEILSEEGRGR